MIRFFVAFFAICILLAPRLAFGAPSLEECVNASEKGDRLRGQSSLRSARGFYLACADPACPTQVREECDRHRGEVEAAIPTVVFAVRDGDATAVTVLLDDEPLVTMLDGKPVPVDPGEHVFTFRRKGYPEQTQKVLLREGERDRAVSAHFAEGNRIAPTGRLVVDSPATATIAIDGQAAMNGGHADMQLSAGAHQLRVTETGKVTYAKLVEVKPGETRQLTVVLEREKKKSSLTPWLVGGGAVVIAAAIIVGGIFAFSTTDTKNTPAPSTLGGVAFKAF